VQPRCNHVSGPGATLPPVEERYEAELTEPERAEALDKLRAEAMSGPLTLLTATRDLDHSQAAVLARLLAPE